MSIGTAAEALVGVNRDAAPLPLMHAALEKERPDSACSVRCPACKLGLLLCSRDPASLRLRRRDHCVLCAQRVVYLDEAIGGELLLEPVPGFSTDAEDLPGAAAETKTLN